MARLKGLHLLFLAEPVSLSHWPKQANQGSWCFRTSLGLQHYCPPSRPSFFFSQIYLYNLHLIQIDVHILLVCRGCYRVKVAKITQFTFLSLLECQVSPCNVSLSDWQARLWKPPYLQWCYFIIIMCSLTAALTNVLPEILYNVLVQSVALFIHHIDNNISIHQYGFDSQLILPIHV